MINWKFTKFRSAQVKFSTCVEHWVLVHDTCTYLSSTRLEGDTYLHLANPSARLRLVVAEVQLWGSAIPLNKIQNHWKSKRHNNQPIWTRSPFKFKWQLKDHMGPGLPGSLAACGSMMFGLWLEPRMQKMLEHRRDHHVEHRCQLPRNVWKVVNSLRPRYRANTWIYCASVVCSCASQKEYGNMTQSTRCLRSRQAWVQQAAWSLYIHDTARLLTLQQWLEAVRWARICLCGGQACNFCSVLSPAKPDVAWVLETHDQCNRLQPTCVNGRGSKACSFRYAMWSRWRESCCLWWERRAAACVPLRNGKYWIFWAFMFFVRP